MHRGNLFEAAEGKPKAHCVSADLAMGKGIALQFRQRYGKPPQVLGKSPAVVGEVIVQIPDEGTDRTEVFHLVTKQTWRNLPTVDDLMSTMKSLRRELEHRNLREVWMPKIACGLDRMDWDKQVFPLLYDVFFGWEGTVHVVVQ